jgi:hypothetical protein
VLGGLAPIDRALWLFLAASLASALVAPGGWLAARALTVLRGGTLGAVLAATLTAGAFDAVPLLAAPTFLACTAAGALAGGDRPHAAARRRPAARLLGCWQRRGRR